MAISNDVQKLEPGDSVRLVTVDGSAFGAGVLRFHACTIPHTPEEIAASGGDTSKLAAKSIWFDGEEYGAWPLKLPGWRRRVTARARSRCCASLTLMAW